MRHMGAIPLPLLPKMKAREERTVNKITSGYSKSTFRSPQRLFVLLTSSIICYLICLRFLYLSLAVCFSHIDGTLLQSSKSLAT